MNSNDTVGVICFGIACALAGAFAMMATIILTN